MRIEDHMGRFRRCTVSWSKLRAEFKVVMQ